MESKSPVSDQPVYLHLESGNFTIPINFNIINKYSLFETIERCIYFAYKCKTNVERTKIANDFIAGYSLLDESDPSMKSDLQQARYWMFNCIYPTAWTEFDLKVYSHVIKDTIYKSETSKNSEERTIYMSYMTVESMLNRGQPHINCWINNSPIWVQYKE